MCPREIGSYLMLSLRILVSCSVKLREHKNPQLKLNNQCLPGGWETRMTIAPNTAVNLSSRPLD